MIHLSYSNDYRGIAMRIRQAVEKQQLAKLIRVDSDRIQLPNFPKVEVRGTGIVIIEEGGREQIWGNEGDRTRALDIAGEMQVELRAIRYVRTCLAVYLSKLAEDLEGLDISKEHLDEIIFEGYRGLGKWFMELADSGANI